MKIQFILRIFVLTTLFISCTGIPSEVKSVIKNAGSNKQELEKVIEHYQLLGDKQKLQAAYFLIGNMGEKHSLYYGYNEKAYELTYTGKSEDKVRLKKEIDSLIDKSLKQPLIVYDKDVITADYLIKNIDLAFKVWEEPWSKHFNFEEFCEYILPYRIRTEPLSDWRQLLYNKYYWVKDSVNDISDTEEMTLYVNDVIATQYKEDDNSLPDLPLVPITLLDRIKAGSCDQRYMFTVSVFRAMGIPAMIDYTPQINRKYEDHTWTAYLNSSHRLRAIDGGHIRDIPFVGNTGLRRAFPDSTIIPLRYGFGPSVFRYTYAANKESLPNQIGNLSEIPQQFRNLYFKNVTDQYEFRKQNIRYQLEQRNIFKNNIAYLAVFTTGKELRVADWAHVTSNTLEFKNIGSNLTYIICDYVENKLIPVSNPILLKNSTSICLQPNMIERETVTLTRKYKPSLEYNNFSKAMIGSIFQGSNDSQFKTATNLFEIDKSPQYMEEGDIDITDKFRYIRYYSPEKNIHIAEIELWGIGLLHKPKKLNGKIIYSIKSDTTISDCFPKHALDGSIRTNFNAPAGSWVGLDLGIPKQISQVKFLPRNNFNVVEPGNTYELFYYDKGWYSLGIKIAENQSLKYDDVPKNSLLLLSNRTQGKEERVFTYENGRQIFQ